MFIRHISVTLGVGELIPAWTKLVLFRSILRTLLLHEKVVLFYVLCIP
jgi:hypothetical protein